MFTMKHTVNIVSEIILVLLSSLFLFFFQLTEISEFNETKPAFIQCVHIYCVDKHAIAAVIIT